MTKPRRAFVAVLSMFVLCAASSAVFAAAPKTPAEVLASVTGRTVESVTAEKAKTGKTYGRMAKEAGKLTEFKKASLEARKARIKEQAASGRISKERAAAIIKEIDRRIAACDGAAAGKGRVGQESGTGFGSGGKGAGGSGNANGVGRR